MAELVSPCCGAEYSDHCDDDINEYFQCEQCKEYFNDPTEDYEYNEQKKESIAEDRMDEKRDMGL